MQVPPLKKWREEHGLNFGEDVFSNTSQRYVLERQDVSSVMEVAISY
jgi:hypothetical protein